VTFIQLVTIVVRDRRQPLGSAGLNPPPDEEHHRVTEKDEEHRAFN